MLDLNYIRQNPDKVRQACKNKKVDESVDAFLELDTKRRAAVAEVEKLRAAQKTQGATFAAEKDPAAREKASMELKLLKDDIKKLEAELSPLEQEMHSMLLRFPNVPSDDTPVGPDESGNVVLREVGKPTEFAFKPKDHIELGAALGLIDSEKAGEVSGSRFTYLKGDLVLLQNALYQYALSVLTNRDVLGGIIEDAKLDVKPTPFVPVVPPLMIRPEVFERMARLEPREERYHIPSDDLFLIGSAEHTLGPIHMDETLKEEELPRRYFAFTPAFRREAGSYGKDVKGILRLHQFDKIEMESFCLPETSVAEQNLFVAIQEHILKALGVPYRAMQICTGDMGGPDARQIDLECWMPGQDRYRETHTSDLMTDYQARRLGTRVRRADGTSEFVHMNDATALAMGRILIALMENFQEADGTIRVPEVLHPYMHGKTHLGK